MVPQLPPSQPGGFEALALRFQLPVPVLHPGLRAQQPDLLAEGLDQGPDVGARGALDLKGGAGSLREGRASDAVGAVLSKHRLEADRIDSRRVPGIDARGQLGPLFDAQGPDQRIEALE